MRQDKERIKKCMTDEFLLDPIGLVLQKAQNCQMVGHLDMIIQFFTFSWQARGSGFAI